MAITIKKYVDITSGVGGAAQVKERELILRLFTTKPGVAADEVLEMTTLEDVVTKFGVDSEEYKRAAQYFGFVSKSITKARKISFAHLTAGVPTPPSITGGTAVTVLATWKAISNGHLKLTVGSIQVDLPNLDFTSVSDLAGVASAITGVMQVVPGLSTASVSFDTGTQKFNAVFTGVTPPAQIVIQPATSGDDVSDKLGWTAAKNPVLSPGSLNVTALQSLIAADEISDNYGSFAFCGGPLDHDTVESIAEWNNAQNVKYMYLVPVTSADYGDWYGTLQTFSGTAMTLVADNNVEYDEQIPGIILGATNYNLRAASQNYMYQQVAGVSPKVVDNSVATNIDTNTRVNYYGLTKNAGQKISFYQNGYLCGLATSPLQMTVYANEQWFKSAATALLLNLQLTLPIISASDDGRATVLAGLQSVIDRALTNGTIKAEKPLDVTQKAYILQITGDPLAWVQIQSIGYWMDATVTKEVQTNGTELFIIDYTLLYSKGDAVNKITGRDILI